VNVDWFLNGTCAGAPAVNSGSVGPLTAGGTFDATAFNFTVNSAGARAFKAHYEGDGTYTGSDGPCEALAVVDANIQITPATAVNPVGTNHTLTGHVNVNPGTGFVNAPAGTVISFSLTNTLGATATFVGPNQCTTSGVTGSCTVVISSPTAGTTMIQATTTVSVGGISLTRTTGDGHAGDSANAQKNWEGGGGLITETQVDCSDVLSGAAATMVIDQINYPGTTTIGQGINPGKFYYWAKITTTTANQVVTVTQTHTGTAPLFLIHQDWQRVYTGNCASYTTGTQVAGGAGATFTIPTPGNYIIGIKYDPKSLVGKPVPVPATVTYTFSTGAPSSEAKVKLGPA
jgi:hypothetical protein